MRLFSILAILLAMIAVSCTHTTTKKKKAITGAVWEVNDQGDSVLMRYEEGRLTSFSTFRDGVKNGIAKQFYSDGKVQYEIYYEDGVKNGITKWYYKNGQLYKKTNYKNGKREGIVIKYYRDGKLKAKEPYQNGIVMPGLKEYTKSGKLKTIYPTIRIQPIDQLGFKNKYILRCSLSNEAKSVKFFRVIQLESGIYKEEIETHGGIAEVEYVVPRGGYLMRKEIIRAEYKTNLSNIYVLEREYNLALDN